MINSKECAAEDKPGYFICLSQQKEKGIHMNTFLQSVQNLDGEILLQIQQHLRTDMLTPFMKIVTFLGNGGWFWILCAVVLLAVPKTRKTGYAAVLSLIFGVIVTNLLLKNIVARPRPFAEIEALIPLIAKPTDFSFPSGHTTASFAVALVMLRMLPKKIGNPGSSPGQRWWHFPIVSWCPLSNRCPGLGSLLRWWEARWLCGV